MQEDFVKFKPETADFTEGAIRKFTEKFVAGKISGIILKFILKQYQYNAKPICIYTVCDEKRIALVNGFD